MSNGAKCIAISGGVGGAKLALGLAHRLDGPDLTVVANTGDDFRHLGFDISPDLDTVMYTLADLANKDLGWGQAGETWQFLAALEKLGGETWFRLGDRDLATHTLRSQMLAAGKTLSEVTKHLCEALGIKPGLVPMSDDPVRTIVTTAGGEKLGFQQYFVRDRCVPVVTGFEFEGIASARPALLFIQALEARDLSAVVICPSNPFVSVDPVLHLAGIREAMQRSPAPVIAVSPIVGGEAIKGPAAKMMKELGMPTTAAAVAKHYKGRIDGFVLDQRDAALQSEVEDMGMKTLVVNTMMITLEDRIALADAVLGFASGFDKKES